MSIVINPSLWYARLVNYKNGSDQDYTLVAALIAAYLTAHQNRIEPLLGGALSHIAVVPSTRGRRFDIHPLANAVKRSRAFGSRLSNALSHVAGATIKRQEYKPSIYSVDASLVRGGRVVIVEDLWVSGARAVSAAGAIMDAGAKSVLILPVARELRSSNLFCPEEYVADVKKRYDVDAWPR